MIKPFGPDSEHKLDMNEFNKSSDYRGALVEAMRIMSKTIPKSAYSEEFVSLIEKANDVSCSVQIKCLKDRLIELFTSYLGIY